jgi:hypothetical protein
MDIGLHWRVSSRVVLSKRIARSVLKHAEARAKQESDKRKSGVYTE